MEDGEAEKSQEEVDGEGQAGQAQVDGASGSTQLGFSHSGGKRVSETNDEQGESFRQLGSSDWQSNLFQHFHPVASSANVS